MNPSAWDPLGTVPPTRLAPTRLILHHAAQLVASVGRSLVPARPDDGHTSLEWLAERRGLAGEEVPGARPWRAVLNLEETWIEVLVGTTVVDRLVLQGHSRREAFEWLDERAGGLGAPGGRLSLEAPYTLPAHPFGAGVAFEASADGSLAEVARWFANGDAVLREVARDWPGSAPVRVWPHHFDVGSVLPLGGGHGGEDAPTIGIGLSPGDEGIAEPYFYVTPWPVPAAGDSLPSLPAGGRWQREGWTGAVLSGSEVVAAGSGPAQAAAASAFLGGAVSVLRARHGKGQG